MMTNRATGERCRRQRKGDENSSRDAGMERIVWVPENDRGGGGHMRPPWNTGPVQPGTGRTMRSRSTLGYYIWQWACPTRAHAPHTVNAPIQIDGLMKARPRRAPPGVCVLLNIYSICFTAPTCAK